MYDLIFFVFFIKTLYAIVLQLYHDNKKSVNGNTR